MPASRAIIARALRIHDRLMPLHDALFVESNPVPVKYAAERLGLCRAEVRLPLSPLRRAASASSRTRCDKAGLLLAEAVSA